MRGVRPSTRASVRRRAESASPMSTVQDCLPGKLCSLGRVPLAKTLIAVHYAGRRLVVVPARRAIVERQDGVAREICWNGIRGGIVGLHHLIAVGEDRLGNAIDEVVRERSVGYDEMGHADGPAM